MGSFFSSFLKQETIAPVEIHLHCSSSARSSSSWTWEILLRASSGMVGNSMRSARDLSSPDIVTVVVNSNGRDKKKRLTASRQRELSERAKNQKKVPRWSDQKKREKEEREKFGIRNFPGLICTELFQMTGRMPTESCLSFGDFFSFLFFPLFDGWRNRTACTCGAGRGTGWVRGRR